jgi:phage gp46-like protein
MDFKVNLTHGFGHMVFEKNTDIGTDLYFSLMIKKGSWFANPDFGCELYKLKKVTDGNLLLAKQYVLSALDWLKTTGRAKSIKADVKKDLFKTNQIDIIIEVEQANGVKLFYEMFDDVRSGKINWSPVGG